MDDPRFDASPLPATYVRQSPPPLGLPALSGDLRADVAIVGGGYTGLAAALHLAERGTRVALLEGHEIGWGGSGRAFGQVVPYAKHDGWHILETFGDAAGERMIAALGAGPDVVFGLIDRYGIKCADRRVGLLFAAHSPAGRATLERRVEFQRKRGAPIELLDATATERAVGSPYYATTVLDRRGGSLTPLALVRGMGWAAKGLGVDIQEHSPVRQIVRHGKAWRVVTADGAVEAGSVLVATGAYSNDLWPNLRQSFIPMRAFQLVSTPLSANVRGPILPGGQSLTDTRRLYSGVRLLDDGRLHVSADGPAFVTGGSVFRGKAERRVRSLFPQIASLEWEEAWSGWVDVTTDQYPRLHELEPGLWAAMGLSGRGIAWGVLLGREVAWRMMDMARDQWFMPVTPLRRAAVRPYAAPLVGALMAYYRVLDRFEMSGYVGRRNPDNR